MQNLEIKQIVSAAAQSNTFVVSSNNSCIIVDAGAKLEDVLPHTANKKVEAILITHSHFDHILCLESYIKQFNCKVYLQKLTLDGLYDESLNLSSFFGYEFNFTNKNFEYELVSNNYEFTVFNNILVKVITAKGHSLDGTMYLFSDMLFAGDVLFASGIGRYDFYPQGKQDTLNTLKQLKNLTGYNTVYSGHGASSTFDRQQRNIDLHIKFLSRK